MILISRLLGGSLHRQLRGIASFTAGTPPIIPSNPETVQAYGHTWRDDYHWIQSQPHATERLLRQEAAYFRHVAHSMSNIAALSSQLRAEIQELLPHQTTSVGEMIGGWEYLSEQSNNRPLPVYSRRRVYLNHRYAPRGEQKTEEKEILLDVNELEEIYGEGISVQQIKISKCGNLVAFTLAENGIDDVYSVVVRDVKTGSLYEQPALRGVVSVEWDGDDETLLATQPDELGRPARVVATSFTRHIDLNSGGPKSRKGGKLFQKPSATPASQTQQVKVLFEEKDPRYFLELQRTKDWKYLMINSNSKTSSEVHIMPTKRMMNDHADGEGQARGQDENESSTLTCVQPRRPGLEYFLEHLEGKIYTISNGGNAESNYDLSVVDVETKKGAMNKQFWTKMKTSRGNNVSKDVFIEDLDVNHNGIVLYQRSCTTGKPEIEIIPLESVKNLKTSGGDGGGGDDDVKDLHVVTSYSPQLPDYAWYITPGANADYYSDTLRVNISSPVHPDQAIDVNLNLKKKLFEKENDDDVKKMRWKECTDNRCILSGHTPDDYILEKIWAPILSSSKNEASEAAAVPISLIYPNSNTLNKSKDIQKSSVHNNHNHTKPKSPCLVVVYASYGINLPTDFALERLPLLQRGWTIALIHARGGGELGRKWHAAGRGPINKPNSARDVETAIEYLIKQGYTMPGSIVMEATSAGAVAAGGVLNSRPDLFSAVVLESPFVDVLSTMIDPELPLTVHEYEEFGNPSTKIGMQGLKTICPYQNIFQKKKNSTMSSSNFAAGSLVKESSKSGEMYPPVLITCSSTDARVPIWGPLKYAAKLRAAATGHGGGGNGASSIGNSIGRGSVLVYADAHGGHLADDREKYDVKAVQYAFMLDAMKQQQQLEE